MPRSPMPLHPHTWDADLVARVKAAWLAGTSARSISATLAAEGVARSHSSIIGRMRREGLSHMGPRPSGTGLPKTARKPRAVARKATSNVVVKAPSPPPAPRPAPRPQASDVVLPESLRVAIWDVRDGLCRWIAGDLRVDPTACGHPTVAGSSYCEGHRIIGTAARRPSAAVHVPMRRAA